MKRVILGLCIIGGLALSGCAKTAIPLTDNASIPIPVISDITYSSSGVKVDWSTVDTSDIAYFELYIKSPYSNSYQITPIIISANATSYTSSDIISEGVGEYLFVLSAVNLKNEQGRSSNVYKFNFQGYKVSLSTWSSIGSTTLDGPQSIAVSSSKRIFIADTNNHRILEVSESGTLVHEFGSQGSGTGQFFSPMGLAMDSSGRVIVADANNDRIVRFDPDNFLATFVTLGKVTSGAPVSGTGTGEFNFPVSCTVGPTGNIYVSDLQNSRIQRIELGNDTNFSGSKSSIFSSSIAARELTSTTTRMYILDNSGHLYIKTFAGAQVGVINILSQALANNLMDSKSFRGIAVDEVGQEIFVSSDDGDQILAFSFSGSLSGSFGVTGSTSGNFNKPAGLSFSDSKLYVSETGNNRIQVFR